MLISKSTVIATIIFMSQISHAEGFVQRKLDGVWKLKSFMCERGEQDQTVVDSQKQVEKGLKEETLTIKGDMVKIHTVLWDNDAKKDSCTLEQKQTWKIGDTNYQVTKNQVLSAKSKGKGKCPSTKDNFLSDFLRPYIVDGRNFKFAISDSMKQTDSGKAIPVNSHVPCKGGRWVMTYEHAK
jgi:hypothetical protein